MVEFIGEHWRHILLWSAQALQVKDFPLEPLNGEALDTAIERTLTAQHERDVFTQHA